MADPRCDSVLYRKREFTLLCSSNPGLFQPQDHGLAPQPQTTPDRRGFLCDYRVEEESLLLGRVQLGVTYQEQLLVAAGRGPSLLGARGCVAPEDNLRVVYSGLSTPVCFSGGLLLGEGYIHAMPLVGRELELRKNTCHPAYEWHTIQELLFEEGRLVEARDCSGAIAQARRDLTSGHHEIGSMAWRAELARLTSQAFRADYRC
ncbi:hypothetical protein [Myxococcus landrumensis]|uniref:Uncharacterized protein n=1 Tax=Myxococcus landrumensis TaxID=2813577 RepID=A0ABX7NAV0_9BACT|nr:hypothetical protein [Myxococcus landrumus]QSQ15621.1 hypothetical protein JY572_06020 [Myxococcus landrumus]